MVGGRRRSGMATRKSFRPVETGLYRGAGSGLPTARRRKAAHGGALWRRGSEMLHLAVLQECISLAAQCYGTRGPALVP
jgi:hypothetical protein